MCLQAATTIYWPIGSQLQKTNGYNFYHNKQSKGSALLGVCNFLLPFSCHSPSHSLLQIWAYLNCLISLRHRFRGSVTLVIEFLAALCRFEHSPNGGFNIIYLVCTNLRLNKVLCDQSLRRVC